MVRLISTLILAVAAPAQAGYLERPWNEDVIYFALTDRFLDGDPANNVPAGSDPALHDPEQKENTKYHGGDFRGIEQAIASGYFEALGVTALWLTPPVRNVWNSPRDLGGTKTGYHGYWTQDFLDIDPHLVSSRSLDGKSDYPDTRDGRMQHYKDLVSLAHAHGLKVIQDIVINHAGPVFYYDANENGQLDREQEMEWRMPYRPEGFYPFAKWLSIPEWNALPTMPGGPVSILGAEVKTSGLLQTLSTYSRRGMNLKSLAQSNGEEMNCDFFALRDIATSPGSAHFDRLVDEFVTIYRYYLEQVGVDGFRIDTVRHVHREFWEAFTARLRASIGAERARRLILFGEVYDGSPFHCGKYTFPLGWPKQQAPVLDSVLNFPVCFAARSYLRHTVDVWGSARVLEEMLKSTKEYNPTPGTDGLHARQKLVNFVENHDGLNRFRVAGVSERSNLLANALILTLEGIPCLYYGTEAALQDTRGNTRDDTETGRMTFVPHGAAGAFAGIRTRGSFTELAAAIQWRSRIPALTRGEFSPLWVDSGESEKDDGIFAFARTIESGGKVEAAAVIVFNAGRVRATTAIPNAAMPLISRSGAPLLTAERKLTLRATIPARAEFVPAVVLQTNKKIPAAAITVPAQSAAIFTIEP